VLDYRISMEISGTFQVIAATTSTTFKVLSLESGQTYSFKVQARNDYGTSDATEVLSLLCAFVPDAPPQPDSAISGDLVTVTWLDPAENGSPITGYKLYFLAHSGEYVEESAECLGSTEFVL
jgi:hypothetical protein